MPKGILQQAPACCYTFVAFMPRLTLVFIRKCSVIAPACVLIHLISVVIFLRAFPSLIN